MGGWRVSRAGRVLLGLIAVGALSSAFARQPWSTLGGLLGLLIILIVLSNTFVGRTAITMSDQERMEYFRRMYKPGKRSWD